MKFLLTICLFFSIHCLFAQAPVSPSAAATSVATSADEKAVIETEKQRFVAQINKDFAVLDKVLGDDLAYNHSNGNTDGKASFLQTIRDGKTVYQSIDIEEQKARIYGNTAVINGYVPPKSH